MMNSRSLIGGVAALALLAFSGAARAQLSDVQNLHDALHLTAAQESAWRAYRQGSAPDHAAEGRHLAASQMIPTLPTPRRVDLVTAEMEADLNQLKKSGAAAKAFYEQLSSEQRTIFDRLTVPKSEGRFEPEPPAWPQGPAAYPQAPQP